MDERKIQSSSSSFRKESLLSVYTIELLKKADRIRQNSSTYNSKEKIDIYHQTAEAYRSIGNYFFHEKI